MEEFQFPGSNGVGIFKWHKTQFQIEGGDLVQGVTKLITILLTFVTLNKNHANLVDRKWS